MLVSAASDGARAGAQASPAHAELNGRTGKPECIGYFRLLPHRRPGSLDAGKTRD